MRIKRWRSRIAMYNVELAHRSGKENIDDFLSRRLNRDVKAHTNMVCNININLENEIEQRIIECTPTAITIEQLENYTEQ